MAGVPDIKREIAPSNTFHWFSGFFFPQANPRFLLSHQRKKHHTRFQEVAPKANSSLSAIII